MGIWKFYERLYSCLSCKIAVLLRGWVRSNIYLLTTYCNHLRRPSWSGNIVFDVESTSFPGFSQVIPRLSLFDSLSRKIEKRQMTLGTRLFSRNKSNKYQLIFNLDPRVIICLLKCRWILFQKATRCYSINFFLSWCHFLSFKSKIKKVM